MRLAKGAVEKPPAHPPIDASCPTRRGSAPPSVVTAALSRSSKYTRTRIPTDYPTLLPWAQRGFILNKGPA